MKELIVSDFKKCPFLKSTYDYMRTDFECALNGKDLGYNDKLKCKELCEMKEGICIKLDSQLESL